MHFTVQRCQQIIAEWRADAARRKAVSASDQQADVFVFCANTLEAALNAAADEDEEISTAEYAAMHHRGVSTIRRWCKAGLLVATKKGKDYVIRRGEPCPKMRVAS